MAVSPDAAKQLKVSFRTPREGSCLTREIVQELASLLEITLPTSTSDAPCISEDAGNLAQLDAQNCLLVPATSIYTEEKTWSASAASDLDFTAFSSQQFDATTCFFSCHIFPDPDEPGEEVKAEPSGTEFIRPSYEIRELSADKITIRVHNATSDLRVQIRLLKLPVPPEKE